ncbi:MAG: hypothetical protein P1U77_24260 [Rubripirellula sp.]|jgi:hypothetical protein|nr:hypothetical protein [Rubripirellula sp.]
MSRLQLFSRIRESTRRVPVPVGRPAGVMFTNGVEDGSGKKKARQ